MNIQILDSWLKEHVKTKATPKQIAELLSLSSVSVEKLEKHGKDYLYDIEVTTNRPDLMSIVGLARETTAVLKRNKIDAEFIPLKFEIPEVKEAKESINVINNPKLVSRICAVIMDVNIEKSPSYIKERLEASGIRSLNNLIDITNYVMRAIGHPTHVFDFDLLPTKTIEIRESRPNEKIKTLDGKEYNLTGGDIVADDGLGHIVDLLGIMGLENSASNSNTKRILFFIDDNDPNRIRKTSMKYGIRTEAAVLNEKGISPEFAHDALLYGIKLYEKYASGTVISEIVDIYPNKVNTETINVHAEKINSVIGVNIPLNLSENILSDLGFKTKQIKDALAVTPPHFRANDVRIEEDVIEEIARIYGYHNVPNKLPEVWTGNPINLESNEFYFEDRVRDALKYWGMTEVYTYPMVSENLYEGEINSAVEIQNPLNEEFIYMRKSLVPSLLKVAQENKNHENISIFEIANVYEKNGDYLPKQTLKLAVLIKNPHTSFYKAKGIIEQLLFDLGATGVVFMQHENGATVSLKKDHIGEIEMLDQNIIDFELNFETILKHATTKKIYKPVSKFPPIIEDMALVAPEDVPTGDLIETIKKQSSLIIDVSLLDKYQDTRTFHIIYQSRERNLKSSEIGEIREKILKALKEKHKARLKE